jgi:cell division protein FtsL
MMPDQIIASLPVEKMTSLFFLITVFVYTVFSGIMYYHWQAYSVDRKVTFLTFIVYSATTLPLLLLLGTLTYFV